MSGLMPSTVDYVHRHEILPLLGEQFKKLDPSFDENRKSRKAILAFLLKELASLQKSGYPMSASEQILLEAKWLINYTIRWPEADKRLEDARRSLCNLKQDALVQGNDGAFDSGACNTPYRKFEPTVDALQDRNLNPATLRPLTFMKDFFDPKHLLDRLWDLQITDVAATEYNGRDELGATQSAFSQLIFKDNLRALLDPPASNLDFRISPALEAIPISIS